MAGETISSLPSVSTPNSTDLVPIEHGAAGGPYTLSQTTIADILALAPSGSGSGSGSSSSSGASTNTGASSVAPSLVQSGVNSQSGNSQSFPSIPTAGNMLIACFAVDFGSNTTETTVNIPSGWTILKSTYTGIGQYLYVAYKLATGVSSEQGFTVNSAVGSIDVCISLDEWKNAAIPTACFASTGNNAPTLTAPANSVVYGAFAALQNGTDIVVESGYSNHHLQYDVQGDYTLEILYQLTSAGGTFTPSITDSGEGDDPNTIPNLSFFLPGSNMASATSGPDIVQNQSVFAGYNPPSSWTLSLPNTPTAGNLLLFIVRAGSLALPSGSAWTEIFVSAPVGAFYKIATGNAANDSLLVTTTGSGGDGALCLFEIENFTTGVFGYVSEANQYGYNLSPPAVVEQKGALIFTMADFPAGASPWPDFDHTFNTFNIGNPNFQAAYKKSVRNGSTQYGGSTYNSGSNTTCFAFGVI